MIVQHKINMYQRRAKRVAGPGFHVNVKMDQFQIATMRGKNGITGQSPLIPSSSQPEMYDIKEQEILVAKKTSGSMYHDGYTHVFSVVNGYDVGTETDPNRIKERILSEVRFVGIATTEQKADDRLIDQGCVATVGGVVTVLNNGNEPIHPTQKVMIDINLHPARASITREKGIPRQKVRFSFRPADDDITLVGKALKMCPDNKLDTEDRRKEYESELKQATREYNEAIAAEKKARADGDDEDKIQGLRAARKALDKKRKDLQLNLKNCAGTLDGNLALNNEKLLEFLQNYRHLNERVIGKAMSYAAAGDRFELLLQPRHSL